MATVLTTIAPVENCTDSAARRQGDEAPKDSPLFRFGLRQLFAFVAAICAVLAAMATLSGLTFLVLLVAVTIVVMHVFATALGSCLQSRTECEQRRQQAIAADKSDLPMPFRSQAEGVQAVRSASRSPWHGRGCTYLPWLPRLVIGAMVLGGLIGAVLLSGSLGDRTSPEGIIVGALSFAVLGGWISFLAGNFYGVFRHGFREALAEERKDHVAATRAQH